MPTTFRTRRSRRCLPNFPNMERRTFRRAYGDWARAGLRAGRKSLHEFAIRPIQQFSYSTGKNASDIALVIDAMELLYTQNLDAFCIASSDADFTPLVMQLKANGHEVYGFGARKTPVPFVNACTTFLYLEGLGDPAPHRRWPILQLCQVPRRNSVSKGGSKSGGSCGEAPGTGHDAGGGPARKRWRKRRRVKTDGRQCRPPAALPNGRRQSTLATME